MTFQLETTFVPSVTTLLLYPMFIVSAILCAYYYWQQQTRIVKLGNIIPGPPAIPFFGNALDLVTSKTPREIMERVLELGKDYHSAVRIWFGPKLLVFLQDPADVEVILNSNVHLKKSAEYRFFKPWLGDGLLISHGEKWRSHRKMIAPTFHMNILKSFMDVFNKNGKQVVERMRSEIGKEFDVHDYMSGTTVDILLETAMGLNQKERSTAGFDYAVAVMKMCEIIQLRQFRFWLRFDSIFKWTNLFKLQVNYLDIIHGLTKKVFKERKQDYMDRKEIGDNQTLLDKVTQQVEETDRKDKLKKEKFQSSDEFKGLRDDLDENDENDIGEKKRLAFLDFMIEASQSGQHNVNDKDVKEEVDTIMFEGHDTTAAGSSFVLCMLGVHQDIQKRVMQEHYEIFGESNRSITFADTVEMKYLERVILETLRLYPPVPIIAREITEDVKIVSGNYLLPAGTTVGIGTYKIHRQPHLYPNPEVFDPDNFLPERCQERHYYSYIPFSAGPRSCVGRKYALLKLKVLISTILRNYKIISDVAEKDFKLQGDIILKRADGFRIRIEPRN